MTEWFHPALVLIAGALLLPLLTLRGQKITSLLIPALVILQVAQFNPGTWGEVEFAGIPLVLFQVDRLALVFAWVFAIMAFLGNLYALHIQDAAQRIAAFLYVASAFIVLFAGDWFTLLVGWELMAFASAWLIFASKTRAATGAGFRYLMVHVTGGVLLFGGIVLHGMQTGSYLTGALDYSSGGLAYTLIMVSFLINAAMPPLSAWLTDSYPEATVTGAVFLSAFTTKTAVYVLIRTFPGAEILMWSGAAMALYGVVFATIENDCRRLLGYHIVSQVGFMVAGVGIGTEMALNGAASHAFAHILYKGLLFMGAGAVIYMTGRRKLTEMGGLYRTMPLTLVFYMVGALAISAFPFFSGFVSKSMVIAAAAGDGPALATLMLTVASSGTFLSVGLKLPYFMFFAKDSGMRPGEPPANMLAAMGIAAAFCIVIGIWPGPLYALLPFPVDFAPYSALHITESMGLLMFTLLGFVLLLKILAPENTITLDTDWFYRRGAALFMRFARGPVQLWEQALITLGDGAGLNSLHRLSRQSMSADTNAVDATVNGVAHSARGTGALLRRLQSGIVSHYGLAMMLGLTLLAGWLLLGLGLGIGPEMGPVTAPGLGGSP
ncbi:Na(+)/H(+) antiporter subunit D [Candidatus Halocynthiibacter alkanivorans]|uniref:Na(+)/H(+) antiporter subunit D n=1 Tax=Candidatus Halocynthiibacter alkanivorans TaxID=2267619 RepID=UPI000DF18744|nr:Na(+)/H(+) antiporter subunit D [Candidatus Halocynthiibacter alkanivorans]